MENILRVINLIGDSIQALNKTENEIEIELESFLKVISAVKLEYEDDSSQIRKEMQEINNYNINDKLLELLESSIFNAEIIDNNGIKEIFICFFGNFSL